jgi:hypothetical protein
VSDVLIGILAVVIGLGFCFRGYLAMRVIIPLWGAFAGFMLGAGLVDAFDDTGFLATVLGWVVGAVLAVVFGLLAYLYYEVAVVIGMSAIGFALGTGAMVALGVTWSWVIILVGVGVGALLAVIAIVADLPMAILSVLTATGGATVIVAGLMLIIGVVDLEEFDSAATTQRLADDWWWYAIYIALVVAGLVSQMRSTMALRQSLRETWAASGGKHLRAETT